MNFQSTLLKPLADKMPLDGVSDLIAPALDQTSQRAGIPATEAGIEMIFLELDGLVRRLPGNTYIRTLG